MMGVTVLITNRQGALKPSEEAVDPDHDDSERSAKASWVDGRPGRRWKEAA